MKVKVFILSMFFTSIVYAQAPKGINYQAVARNSQGIIIPAQSVGVRFSILEGSMSGTVIYQESHTTTTNIFGLFTLVIGKGTATSGTFAAVNWASGTDKFLKVEIAPAAGGTYQLQGTTQLLSVPYALYAEKTNLVAGAGINITNGNTISATGTPNYTAGNAISITGNTISAAYQAGTGINIVGPTISGAYQGGNAISITGNTISANYTAGTGININGSTISHNFVAGTGINITGNVISAPGSTNYWLPHANGIYYNAGRVGIGTTPDAIAPLNVFMPNTGVGNAVAVFNSDDTWHTGVMLRNNNLQYAIVMGGSNNIEVRPQNFGILNQGSATGRWALVVEGATNNIGIGHSGYYSSQAKSKLHVFNGDVNIDQIGSGIIMKSPNGACWRITIDNAGNLVRTAITCP